ncbi:hypothetical protein NUACC21_30430 [Scytonema sp. NUACC21]
MKPSLLNVCFDINNNDTPDRINPKAVFAFMVTRLGRKLLRMAMSKNQPANTKHPTLTTRIPATLTIG